jgi:hypothetical protein
VALGIVAGLAVSLGIGFIAAIKAPIGYEDTTGFHYGCQESVLPAVPYVVPEPKLV